MKQKQIIDKQKEELKKQQKQQKRGGRTYSEEFQPISYKDKDMNRLAIENKGSTSSYNYSE